MIFFANKRLTTKSHAMVQCTSRCLVCHGYT